MGRGNGHVDPPARPVDRADAVRPRHGVRRSRARGIRQRLGLQHGPGTGSDRGVRARLDHAGVPLGASALNGGPGHRRRGRVGGDRAVDPRRAGGGRRATSRCARPLPDRLPAERSAAGRRPRSGHGARGRVQGGQSAGAPRDGGLPDGPPRPSLSARAAHPGTADGRVHRAGARDRDLRPDCGGSTSRARARRPLLGDPAVDGARPHARTVLRRRRAAATGLRPAAPP